MFMIMLIVLILAAVVSGAFLIFMRTIVRIGYWLESHLNEPLEQIVAVPIQQADIPSQPENYRGVNTYERRLPAKPFENMQSFQRKEVVWLQDKAYLLRQGARGWYLQEVHLSQGPPEYELSRRYR